MSDASNLDRFHERYRDAHPEDLPWYHPEPDADLLDLLDQEWPDPAARALDLGAGPAVHAIYLAARGLAVTAVDAIPEARVMALKLAHERGVELDYRVGDALSLRLEEPVDLVFDRGFLHTLDFKDRPRWREAVIAALRPGGLVLVKTFDVYPARDFGPNGLRADELAAILGPAQPGALQISKVIRTRFPGHTADHGAWCLTAHRLA